MALSSPKSDISSADRDSCETEKRNNSGGKAKATGGQHFYSMNDKYDSPFVPEYYPVENGYPPPVPRAHWHLYFAAITVNICALNAGCIMGWTSPAKRFLVDEKYYPGPIDEDTWSLIVSIFMLGSAIGPLPQGFLTEKFGRKPCLLGIGVVSVVSWVLTTAATGPAMIIIARFSTGMAIASLYIMLPMYIAEISTDDVRSTLASAMMFSATFGILIAYSLGPYISPLVMGIVYGIIPVVFLVVFSFMPETPYFLVAKGDVEGATKALAWFRGKPPSSKSVERELLNIQAGIQEAGAESAPFLEKVKNIVAKRENLKAFGICCWLLLFAELSGIVPVLFFAESIFRGTGSSLDPALSTIVIGAVQLIASFITLALTRFFSMKTLLILSAVGMTIGHGILGYYYNVKENGGDVSSLGVLPIVALILYMAFYCFGFGPLPWAMMGEILGSDVKATASALVTALGCFVGFILTWKFPSLLQVLGADWTFWTFGIFCAIAFVYSIFQVPDTSGKSLQEIQDKLKGRVR